jgi:hypothetical protein
MLGHLAKFCPSKRFNNTSSRDTRDERLKKQSQQAMLAKARVLDNDDEEFYEDDEIEGF